MTQLCTRPCIKNTLTSGGKLAHWSAMGILHLTILLPGMMSVGTHPIAQVGSVVLISVILTWAYVRSGHSLWTVTFLHGVQNGLVVLNRGLPIVTARWLLFASYFILAVVSIRFDRRTFFMKPSTW